MLAFSIPVEDKDGALNLRHIKGLRYTAPGRKDQYFNATGTIRRKCIKYCNTLSSVKYVPEF